MDFAETLSKFFTPFRLTFDPDILHSIDSLIAASFRDVEGFNSTQAFVATWKDVVPYNESTNQVKSGACTTHKPFYPTVSTLTMNDINFYTVLSNI